ncbi:hypothetical protein ACQEU3_46915 [Spirillospora sp. CA-253888]
MICVCCSRIYRATPPNADQPGRARYAWTHHTGYVTHLCVSCDAAWRANAAEDPDLEPLRITELETP